MLARRRRLRSPPSLHLGDYDVLLVAHPACSLCEAEGIDPHDLVRRLAQKHGGKESEWGGSSDPSYWPEGYVTQRMGASAHRAREGRITRVFTDADAAKAFHDAVRGALPGVKTRRSAPANTGGVKINVWPKDIDPRRAESRRKSGPTDDERRAAKEERRKRLGLPPQTSY